MRSAVFPAQLWLFLFIFYLLHLLSTPVASQTTAEPGKSTEESTEKTPDDNNIKTVIKWIGVAAGIIVLITFAAFLFVFCVLKKRKDQFMKGQSPAEFGLKDESLDKDELLHADPIKNHLEPEKDSARANANASSCSGTTLGETPSAGQEVATPI